MSADRVGAATRHVNVIEAMVISARPEAYYSA